MCVVSMVADHYREKWTRPAYDFTPVPPLQIWQGAQVTRAEFDKLRADVDEMLTLMRRAKEYDKRTGQPDCETDAKMTVLRKVAELVGVDLDAELGKAGVV